MRTGCPDFDDHGRVVRPLGYSDPLPYPPCRIVVAGCSGSGKSTMCRALAAWLDLPYTELDSLFHGPGWVPRPTFTAGIAALAAQPRWVVEWHYREARSPLLARADLLVWLDLPRWRVLSQLIGRTVARLAGRVTLWNGNVEPLLRTIFTDPEHILRWAWSTFPPLARARVRAQVCAVLATGEGPVVVRLGSRREVRDWLAGPVATLVR